MRGVLRGLSFAQRISVAVAGVVLLAGTVLLAWVLPEVVQKYASIPAFMLIVSTVVGWWQLRAEAQARLEPGWRAAVQVAQTLVATAERHRTRLHTAADLAAAEVAALERETQARPTTDEVEPGNSDMILRSLPH